MAARKNPLVSVVMPVLNAEATLIQSLLSVLEQTIKDWELLLVDDGSTDGTPAIGEYFSKIDSRVTYMTPSGTRGPGPARMQGVALARGKFVAFLDADDIWLPEKLEQAVNFMLISGSSWTHTAYRAILKSGKIGRKIGSATKKNQTSFSRKNPIALSTALLERTIIPPEISFETLLGQDRYIWLETAKTGHQPTYLDSATMLYRLSAKSLSGRKILAASERFKAASFEAANPFQQIWSFASYAFGASKTHLLRKIPCRGCEREKTLLEMLDHEATLIQAKLQL